MTEPLAGSQGKVRPSCKARLARIQEALEMLALLDIGDRPGAIVHGFQEIDPVPTHGGGDMFFEVLSVLSSGYSSSS